VVYGSDEYSVANRVRALRREAAGEGLEEANTSVFEGDRINVGEMLAAAHAMPFLAERRVVVVKGLLGRIENPSGGRRGGAASTTAGAGGASAAGGQSGTRVDVAKLTAGLQDLPPTTELIFSDGVLKRNGAGLRAAGPGARLEEHTRKQGADLTAWIAGRFAELGARASPAAVSLLAELVGSDARALDQEIAKLATYAGKEPVQREHVALLVAPAREANVFAAVDAIVERRLAVATRLLYQLLAAGQSVQSVMAIIAAQVKRVLIAQELLATGAAGSDAGEAMAAKVGARPGYQMTKTMEQARRFRREYLVEMMRQLLQADLAIKRGEIDEQLALELLVARLAGTR
jgi:DNA polymerase-3 subunit delta